MELTAAEKRLIEQAREAQIDPDELMDQAEKRFEQEGKKDPPAKPAETLDAERARKLFNEELARREAEREKQANINKMRDQVRQAIRSKHGGFSDRRVEALMQEALGSFDDAVYAAKTESEFLREMNRVVGSVVDGELAEIRQVAGVDADDELNERLEAMNNAPTRRGEASEGAAGGKGDTEESLDDSIGSGLNGPILKQGDIDTELLAAKKRFSKSQRVKLVD